MSALHTLYDEETIRKRVTELGTEITAALADKQPLTVVCVLNGAMIFAADLVRKIQLPVFMDSIAAASYQGAKSTGELIIRSGLKLNVKERTVLLIDDILDTGLTLKKTYEYLKNQGAKEVYTCVLLDKIIPEEKYFQATWAGFRMPPEFVVGYGLDYDEDYRTLPWIGYLK